MFCTLCRWLRGQAADAGRPAPHWTDRHLRRCTRCRSAAATLARAESALRDEARNAVVEPPADLHARTIMAVGTLRNATPTATRRHPLRPAPRRALALATAAALAVPLAIGIRRQRAPEPPVERLDRNALPISQPTLATTDETPPAVQRVLLSLGNRLATPYAAEARAMRRDIAESALFLRDCLGPLLPITPAATEPAPNGAGHHPISDHAPPA